MRAIPPGAHRRRTGACFGCREKGPRRLRCPSPTSSASIRAELRKARHPLLVVETHEDDRAVDEIAAVATDPEFRTRRAVYDWSGTHGLARRGKEGSQATGPPAAALQQVLDLKPAVVVFPDLHHALGGTGRPADPNIIRLLRDVASKFRTNAHLGCLIMVSPVSTLPTDLEKVVTIVDFDLPDEDEIRSLLDGMVEMNKESGRIKSLRPRRIWSG